LEKKEKEIARKIQKQEREVDVHQLARSLDQQLGLSADEIGQEYYRNYYYLGQQFAQGDRKSALCAFYFSKVSCNDVTVTLTLT
jgi:hypothetical protein